jgi:hypothetical protein
VTNSRSGDLPEQLFRTWIRVPEEEGREEGIEVYRPEGHPLPPARGRLGFRVGADGDFEYHGIGPTDVPSTTKGQWRAVGPKKIVVDVEGRHFVLEVVEAADDRLRVQRIRPETT